MRELEKLVGEALGEGAEGKSADASSDGVVPWVEF